MGYSWSGPPITAHGHVSRHGNNRFGLNAFGVSVSMSPEGNFVAVGDKWSESGGPQSGSVFVFQLLENEWAGVGNAIDGKDDYDHSGMSVSLSSEGTRVVIGSPHHDANATYDTGRVCVFERVVKNANPHANTDIGEVLYYDWEEVGSPLDGSSRGVLFGSSVSISNDGTRLAIGSPRSDSAGIDSGMVQVFDDKNGDWEPVGQTITGESVYDLSGASLSLSGDGRRLAIAAPSNVFYGQDYGHVKIFEFLHTTHTWNKLGQNIDGEASYDESGFSISLSKNGSRLAIGSPRDGSGKVRIFQFNKNADLWVQFGPTMTAENNGDMLGFSVSLSGNGDRVSIAAPGNDGNGAGSGHVRVFDSSALYSY